MIAFWQTVSKVLHPLKYLFGETVRYLLLKLFFRKYPDNALEGLVKKSIELLPTQTFSGILILLIQTLVSKGDIGGIRFISELIDNQVSTKHFPILYDNGVEQRKVQNYFSLIFFGNLILRVLISCRSIILWPFKGGLFLWFCSLFGINVDLILNFFDVFKFNIPKWTYLKFEQLHLNWLNWMKGFMQIFGPAS